jgi:hypothetical protein
MRLDDVYSALHRTSVEDLMIVVKAPLHVQKRFEDRDAGNAQRPEFSVACDLLLATMYPISDKKTHSECTVQCTQYTAYDSYGVLGVHCMQPMVYSTLSIQC